MIPYISDFPAKDVDNDTGISYWMNYLMSRLDSYSQRIAVFFLEFFWSNYNNFFTTNQIDSNSFNYSALGVSFIFKIWWVEPVLYIHLEIDDQNNSEVSEYLIEGVLFGLSEQWIDFKYRWWKFWDRDIVTGGPINCESGLCKTVANISELLREEWTHTSYWFKKSLESFMFSQGLNEEQRTIILKKIWLANNQKEKHSKKLSRYQTWLEMQTAYKWDFSSLDRLKEQIILLYISQLESIEFCIYELKKLVSETEEWDTIFTNIEKDTSSLYIKDYKIENLKIQQLLKRELENKKNQFEIIFSNLQSNNIKIEELAEQLHDQSFQKIVDKINASLPILNRAMSILNVASLEMQLPDYTNVKHQVSWLLSFKKEVPEINLEELFKKAMRRCIRVGSIQGETRKYPKNIFSDRIDYEGKHILLSNVYWWKKMLLRDIKYNYFTIKGYLELHNLIKAIHNKKTYTVWMEPSELQPDFFKLEYETHFENEFKETYNLYLNKNTWDIQTLWNFVVSKWWEIYDFWDKKVQEVEVYIQDETKENFDTISLCYNASEGKLYEPHDFCYIVFEGEEELRESMENTKDFDWKELMKLSIFDPYDNLYLPSLVTDWKIHSLYLDWLKIPCFEKGYILKAFSQVFDIQNKEFSMILSWYSNYSWYPDWAWRDRISIYDETNDGELVYQSEQYALKTLWSIHWVTVAQFYDANEDFIVIYGSENTFIIKHETLKNQWFTRGYFVNFWIDRISEVADFQQEIEF